MTQVNQIQLSTPFYLESGEKIHNAKIAYSISGIPKTDGSNVVWICHALTANSQVENWWSGLVSLGKFFSPETYCIVCINNLGSCYGSEGPLSISANKQRPYYLDFPDFTIRDMARFHSRAADELGFGKIGWLLGASMGGQQALEWSIEEPDRFKQLVLIASNARHSSWGIAFNSSQRMALEADPDFWTYKKDAGKKGLEVARSIALLSYRTYETYAQQEGKQDGIFKAESYQRYQGYKLANRFSAHSYWYLSKAMDSHDVGRGRGGLENALQFIQAQTLILSIEGDLLFPQAEQAFLAQGIKQARLVTIKSKYGHDGFLIETEQISQELQGFLALKEVQ